MRLGRLTPRRSRRAAWAASGWATPIGSQRASRSATRHRAIGCVQAPRGWSAASSRDPRAAATSQTLPEHEGQKADEDVSLNAVFALMPYRTDVQLVRLDREKPLRPGAAILSAMSGRRRATVVPEAMAPGDDHRLRAPREPPARPLPGLRTGIGAVQPASLKALRNDCRCMHLGRRRRDHGVKAGERQRLGKLGRHVADAVSLGRLPRRRVRAPTSEITRPRRSAECRRDVLEAEGAGARKRGL